MINLTDEKFMRIAINEASEGFKVGEQPFGSILAKNGEIISIGRNLIELVARDSKGVSVRNQLHVWRESPERNSAGVLSNSTDFPI